MAGFFNLEAAWKALWAGKGGIPASAGDGIDYAFPNNRSLIWDNAAKTATVVGLKVNADDQVELGPRDSGTANATGTGATSTATLNKKTGIITTEALTTASGATHTITLTNSKVLSAASVVLCEARRSGASGGATAGLPIPTKVTPGTGTVDIELTNAAAAAVNGKLELVFEVVS